MWILYSPIKQRSTDSADEIFIPVSISHALIALYLSRETEEETQTEAVRGRDVERKKGDTSTVHTVKH